MSLNKCGDHRRLTLLGLTKRLQATLSRLIKNSLARPAFAHGMPSMIAIAALLVAASSASALSGQDETPTQKKGETKAEVKQDDGSKQDPKPGDTKPADATEKPKGAEEKRPPQPLETKLLEQDFTKTWKLYAAEEGVKVQDVWKINKTESGNILVCTGKPKGYLRTQEELNDYTLSFEFRYPMDENGNSGVLLHIDGKDKIWPDGIQVQLHRPTAGSIFPSGNRKTRFTIGAKLALNLNKWNKCQIDVRKDTVEVRLNDIAVGPMRYCNPARGYFALQSEGSEVHFRDMKLTRYTIDPPVKPSIAKPDKPNPVPPKQAADKPADAKPPAVKTGETNGSGSDSVEPTSTPEADRG